MSLDIMLVCVSFQTSGIFQPTNNKPEDIMPVTAFGSAMMDALNGGDPNVIMELPGGRRFPLNCTPFLRTRHDENELVASLDLAEDAVVLDLGCGIGRHLSALRGVKPDCHCHGIDICDLMLEHCQENIGDPARFGHPASGIEPDELDLVMLMGGGLGVMGSEESAVKKLAELSARISSGGKMLIESGNDGAYGYSVEEFSIRYMELVDGPIQWGRASRNWVADVLGENGFQVEFRNSGAPEPGMFYALATKV